MCHDEYTASSRSSRCGPTGPARRPSAPRRVLPRSGRGSRAGSSGSTRCVSASNSGPMAWKAENAKVATGRSRIGDRQRNQTKIAIASRNPDALVAGPQSGASTAWLRRRLSSRSAEMIGSSPRPRRSDDGPTRRPVRAALLAIIIDTCTAPVLRSTRSATWSPIRRSSTSILALRKPRFRMVSSLEERRKTRIAETDGALVRVELEPERGLQQHERAPLQPRPAANTRRGRGSAPHRAGGGSRRTAPAAGAGPCNSPSRTARRTPARPDRPARSVPCRARSGCCRAARPSRRGTTWDCSAAPPAPPC